MPGRGSDRGTAQRGEAIRRVKLALDEAGVDMPAPVQSVQLEKIGTTTPPETMAKSEPPAQSTVGRAAKAVDVSPDTQLDNQIKEDLSATHESNLLTET